MSEYEGKWPECLHPETCTAARPSCLYMGWHGTESICLADPDEGCPENRERLLDEPDWVGARHHPELDDNHIWSEQIKTIKNLCEIDQILRTMVGKEYLLPTISELILVESQSMTDDFCVIR